MRSTILTTLILTACAQATPSGLNNIPTADTVPQGTVVLQAFTTVGNDRDADFNLGFKTGIDAGWVSFELGASYHILPDKSGPITPHGKIAIPFGEGLPTFAAGVANLSFRTEDRDRAGDEFFYAVLTHDLGWFRVHGGCATQDGKALPFFGIDKTFRTTTTKAAQSTADGKATAGKEVEAISRDLFTVRADAIQLPSNDWLYSAGVLVPVWKHFVFETWGNFPDNGDEPSLTLKANFVFTF